jgi:hypothetical protein
MRTEKTTQETESRLGISIMLSMAMIFTSYAISVLNNKEDAHGYAATNSQRPVIVSYIA